MRLNEEKKELMELNKLIRSLENFKPNIVCTGLLNAGKSTLLNALIGDIDNRTFEVADIRETTTEKRILRDNIVYIDTPGLDASNDDTKVVYDAITSADIILFIHDINTGELDKSEMSFLNEVFMRHPNPKFFLSTIIFVLTKKDNLDPIEEKDSIETISDKIAIQIQNIFDKTPTLLTVSAEVYNKALKGNSAELLKYSNLDSLKKEMLLLIDKHEKTIYNNKKGKIKNTIKKLVEKLKSKRENLFYEKTALMKENELKRKLLKDDLNQLNRLLKVKEGNYKGL